MKQDPDRYQFQIENAANQFLASFGPKLTQNPNGHIVTDIAGAASVTGLMLLRSVCPDLDRFPPGSVVLGDFLDRLYPEQQQMQLFFKNLARQMGLNESDGWNVEPPEALSPLMETSELMRKLEPAFRQACQDCDLPLDYWPHAAGVTTIKLVAAGEKTKLLDETLGKRLATFYMIAGSRTAPNSADDHPLTRESTPPRPLGYRIIWAIVVIVIVFLFFRVVNGK